MKSIKNSQQGFAAVEAALLAVIVVIIAVVALKLVNRKNVTSPVTSTSASSASEVALPSKIKTKGDLTTAVRALDTTPINDKLNPNQLDSNISSLL